MRRRGGGPLALLGAGTRDAARLPPTLLRPGPAPRSTPGRGRGRAPSPEASLLPAAGGAVAPRRGPPRKCLLRAGEDAEATVHVRRWLRDEVRVPGELARGRAGGGGATPASSGPAGCAGRQPLPLNAGSRGRGGLAGGGPAGGGHEASRRDRSQGRGTWHTLPAVLT